MKGRAASRPSALFVRPAREGETLREARLFRLLLLLRELRPDLVHVEGAHLPDEILERRLGQRPGLREEQDLVAQDHQRRDRPDLERPREIGTRLGVDLSEGDVRVLLRNLLVRRGERAARSAPACPPVEEYDPVLLDDLLEVAARDLDRRVSHGTLSEPPHNADGAIARLILAARKGFCCPWVGPHALSGWAGTCGASAGASGGGSRAAVRPRRCSRRSRRGRAGCAPTRLGRARGSRSPSPSRYSSPRAPRWSRPRPRASAGSRPRPRGPPRRPWRCCRSR